MPYRYRVESKLVHTVLELPAPVELFDEPARITPSRFGFHIEFQKDFRPHHAFDLPPGFKMFLLAACIADHTEAVPQETCRHSAPQQTQSDDANSVIFHAMLQFLPGSPSAIDQKVLAGHVATRIAGQENDRAFEVVGAPIRPIGGRRD